MESAQLRMERMLPELRDLEQKKVFTKSEISAIVSQRQIHEAAIARPKSHEPYMRYIDYERRLERLRQLRVSKLGAGQQSKTPHRVTISDYSIPLHILNLFSTAAKRYPESRSLWMAYITYSLTQSSPKLISRVISAAIAAHPTDPTFWTMAARFESDGDQNGKGGGNVDGARKLLMRGLRFLKGEESLSLWIEWIRIELNFVQAMTQRRKFLEKITDKGSVIIRNDGVVLDDSAADTAMELDQLEVENDKADEMDEDVLEIKGQGQEALQSGALIRVVLSNAFKAVPSLSIFDAVIPLLNSTELPIKSALLDFTYSMLQTLHPQLPRARVMVITRELFSHHLIDSTFAISGVKLVDSLSSTIKQLQSICKELSNSEMWEEFLQFLIDVHTKLDDEDLRKYVSLIIKKTMTSIVSKKSDSVRCHELALSHYKTTCPKSEIISASTQASTRFPESLSLCIHRLELMIEATKNGEGNDSNCLQLFHNSQTRFPGSLRVAELYVQIIKVKHSRKEMSDTDMKDLLTLNLDRAAKNIREPILTTTESSPNQSKTVTEVYQRALIETSKSTSRKAIYLSLSSHTTLSINFLNWATSYEKDVNVLEYLFNLLISHPKANLTEWTNYFHYLLNVKKDVKVVDEQLVKAKRLLGFKTGQVLEEKWMELIKC
ncbi:U3 small nucleolar RNA-associated protein 6-domain-containing protein [Melampsora americana]|nr:U3 small nucleolar RNA-associated protein 6-domain-containing protein [Melampsora americana]